VLETGILCGQKRLDGTDQRVSSDTILGTGPDFHLAVVLQASFLGLAHHDVVTFEPTLPLSGGL
jgi:hypothetical protein